MSKRNVASRFRLHSTLIACAAIGTAVALIVPVLVEAERQGVHVGASAIANAALAAIGIAYLLWASAWALPVVMNGATLWLERVRVPQPLIRAALLVVAPVLLLGSATYGVLGGGVAQYRRVRRASAR
ncbi:MAG: hypothetical protein U0610_11175 [bacterium]